MCEQKSISGYEWFFIYLTTICYFFPETQIDIYKTQKDHLRFICFEVYYHDYSINHIKFEKSLWLAFEPNLLMDRLIQIENKIKEIDNHV